jgi:CheY-like chemotaxis protein
MVRRVLLVEDDADLRDMMALLLHLEGFDTTTAVHGREALDRLHAVSDLPHVILLDLMMPVMDGWQFRREQLADTRLDAIPVVVLSAVADRVSDLNAAAVLSKPLDLEILLKTLRCYTPTK